jgi:hypothetical protein
MSGTLLPGSGEIRARAAASFGTEAGDLKAKY